MFYAVLEDDWEEDEDNDPRKTHPIHDKYRMVCFLLVLDASRDVQWQSCLEYVCVCMCVQVYENAV